MHLLIGAGVGKFHLKTGENLYRCWSLSGDLFERSQTLLHPSFEVQSHYRSFVLFHPEIQHPFSLSEDVSRSLGL